MTLATRLRSPDAEERVAAIAELSTRRRAEPEELAALADCLGHPRKAVQRPAAEAFAALARGGVRVDDVLEAALDVDEARGRWGAAFALSLVGELPARAVPVVLQTLGAADGDLRWAAAAIVARLRGRAGLVEALAELVRGDNAAQRKMALYCLRDLDARSPGVEEMVVHALGDVDRDVQLAAITTLARLSIDRAGGAARLLRFLDGGDVRLRRAAAAGLGLLGERSEPVLAALRQARGGDDDSLRRAAEGALRLLGG